MWGPSLKVLHYNSIFFVCVQNKAKQVCFSYSPEAQIHQAACPSIYRKAFTGDSDWEISSALSGKAQVQE